MEIKKNYEEYFIGADIRKNVTGGDKVRDDLGATYLVTTVFTLVNLENGEIYNSADIENWNLTKVTEDDRKFLAPEELFEQVQVGDTVEDEEGGLYIVINSEGLVSLESGNIIYPLEDYYNLRFRETDSYYIQEK